MAIRYEVCDFLSDGEMKVKGEVARTVTVVCECVCVCVCVCLCVCVCVEIL